jgi:hypothetical protein
MNLDKLASFYAIELFSVGYPGGGDWPRDAFMDAWHRKCSDRVQPREELLQVCKWRVGVRGRPCEMLRV